MTADRDPVPTPAELLAAYADDPRALAPAERAAVEALLARDPDAAAELAAIRTTLAAVRHAAPAGEPDWERLHADIGRALDRDAPRRRRPRRALAALGAGLAVAAAALLVWTRPAGPAPTSGPPPAPIAIAADAGPPAPPALEAGDPLDELERPDDLGGGLALDETLDEALDELEPEPAPDLALDEVEAERLLPDSGWIDQLSDEELDRALEWLEAHEPRKAG